MYSKEKFSIAIFLPLVLMYQKRHISLPVGYKTARPKTGDWKRLWRHFRTSKLREKQISRSFAYCELINSLRNGTIVRCLQENKKMSEKSVFREAWSSEMTSQSLPVLCFWSRGFVPPPEVKLDAFGTSKYGEGKSLSKKLFAILIRILRRSNRANKKICHIHFKLPGLSRNGPQGIGRWKETLETKWLFARSFYFYSLF